MNLIAGSERDSGTREVATSSLTYILTNILTASCRAASHRNLDEYFSAALTLAGKKLVALGSQSRTQPVFVSLLRPGTV